MVRSGHIRVFHSSGRKKADRCTCGAIWAPEDERPPGLELVSWSPDRVIGCIMSHKVGRVLCVPNQPCVPAAVAVLVIMLSPCWVDKKQLCSPLLHEQEEHSLRTFPVKLPGLFTRTLERQVSG